jgi:hypothetical protein
MVEPAATRVVVVAPVLTLQVTLEEVTEVTGLLLTGFRTDVVEVVLPAMSVVQMSIG